jgi:two-component system, NtrC family, response regulator AtoC
VVDDEEAAREQLVSALRRDYRVLRSASGEAAIQMLEGEDVNVMLLDMTLPGIGGFDVLNITKENYPFIEVVAVVSDVQELTTAIEAIRQGAFHYWAKGQPADAIRPLVASACERQSLNRSLQRLNAEVAEGDKEFIAGPSKATREVLDLVRKVARLPATVLILGESGTGKELLARMLHREAGDVSAPFVAVNLAAIPKELVESTLFGHEKGAFTGAIRQQIGKFELASGGTLFLDEIGDLRLELQAKLLRALQENEIERVGGTHPIKTNFRLIAATNVDLERAVREARFRDDLYFRLRIIPIRMPALRERIEDVPELANFFLNRYSLRFRKHMDGIAETAIATLKNYWWPGNIRELENVIERLVAISDNSWITDEDLPVELHVGQPDGENSPGENVLDRAVSTFERNFIVRALDRHEWNTTATARALGVPLSTLKAKVKRHHIDEIARRIKGK